MFRSSSLSNQNGAVSPGLLLLALLCLLVAVGLFIWAPWDGTAGLDAPENKELTVIEDPAPAPLPGAVDQQKPEIAGSAPTPGAGGKRKELTGPTSLRGIFALPPGIAAGSGEVELKSAAPDFDKKSLGSIFKMITSSTRSGGIKNLEKKGKEWAKYFIEEQQAVALVPLGRDGKFNFVNPPAGDYQVKLRHSYLKNAAPVTVKIKAGEQQDLGVLGVHYAGSLLVVVSNTQGKPLAGATVSLNQGDKSNLKINPLDPQGFDVASMLHKMLPNQAKTDQQGICSFAGLEPGQQWRLKVTADGFATTKRVVEVLPARENLVRLDLLVGAVVTALVRDPAGQPFEDAKLEVDCGGKEMGLTTDKDGRARRSDLPAGKAKVILKTAGFLPAEQEVQLTAGKETAVSFQLQQGLTITGLVLDEDNRPLPGALVRNLPQLGQKVMGLSLDSFIGRDLLTLGSAGEGVKTGPDGRFMLGGFKAGEKAQLLATAQGHDSDKVGNVPAGTKGVEMELQRLATLTGKVTLAPTGKPVTDFSISIGRKILLVIDQEVVAETYTGRADGTFRLTDIPRERFKVVIKAANRAPWTRYYNFSRGDVAAGTIELAEPAGIVGVTRGPDGAPLPGVQVYISKGGIADALAKVGFSESNETISDDQGAFKLAGIPAKTIRLSAAKKGYAPTRSRAISLVKGQITRGVEIRLTRGGSLRGLVVDSEGTPLVGWLISVESKSGLGQVSGKSDGTGSFLLTGLAGGNQKVTAVPSDFAEQFTVSAKEQESLQKSGDISMLMSRANDLMLSGQVKITDGAEAFIKLVHEEKKANASGNQVRVTGRVRLGNRPLAKGTVAFIPSGSELPRCLTPIKSGAFVQRDLPPGPYRVQVQSGLFSNPIGPARQVIIPAEPSHQLDIELPGGSIVGKVVDSESGQPVSGLMVSLSGGEKVATTGLLGIGGGMLFTDETGSFQFTGLGAGTYAVYARELGLVGGSKRSGRLSGLILGAGQELGGVVLTLDGGASLAVDVSDGSGPRANVEVRICGDNGNPLGLFPRTFTGLEGRATFTDLPEGVYRVKLVAPRVAPQMSDPVAVTVGAKAHLALSLVPGIPVSLSFGANPPAALAGSSLLYSVVSAGGMVVKSGHLRLPSSADKKSPVVWKPMPLGSYAPGKYTLRLESLLLGFRELPQAVPASGATTWEVVAGDLSGR